MTSNQSEKQYVKEALRYQELLDASKQTPECIKEYIRKLEHENFFLYEFTVKKHLWPEVEQYLIDTKDDPIPFPFE